MTPELFTSSKHEFIVAGFSQDLSDAKRDSLAVGSGNLSRQYEVNSVLNQWNFACKLPSRSIYFRIGRSSNALNCESDPVCDLSFPAHLSLLVVACLPTKVTGISFVVRTRMEPQPLRACR